MLPIDKLPKILPESSPPVYSIKPPASAASFCRGDMFRALVVQKLNSNEILLSTNGTTILAETNLSLKVGDTLQLKVAETHPQIILSPALSSDGEEIYLKSNLAMFRSFPQGMLNVVKDGLELFQGNLQTIFPFIEKGDMNSIHSMINALIFSEKSLDNPLFLKQFIINIGYVLEHSLRKSSEYSTEKEGDLGNASRNNLKSLLTHLSTRLHLLMSDSADSDIDPQLLNSLNKLANYADSSLETIYNHHVVNVIGQEEEQGYYFQIPIKLADDLRMADLFINVKDRNAKKNKKNDQFQFVLFLNMDALGDIMVDIKYDQKKIQGTFKCSRVESFDFLQEFLVILNDRLNVSGYGPSYLNVYRSSNLDEEKSDFMKDKIIFSKEIINCFA